MSRTIILAVKDLRLLARDHMGLFWAFGFPLIMALFFGSLFGGGGGTVQAIPLAVIDEDGTPQSKTFVARLSASAALLVSTDVPLDEAQQRVRRGKLVAYLRIGKGYGATFSPFGAQSPLELGIDPARAAEKGMLQGVLTAAAFQSMQDRLLDPAAMRSQVGEVMKQLPGDDAATGQDKVVRDFMQGLDTFLGSVDENRYKEGLALGTEAGETPSAGASGGGLGTPFRLVEVAHDDSGQPRGPFDISFPSAVLWGVLGCASSFALSMVRERIGGTLQRLRAAPMAGWQILAGKGLACFFACASVMTLLLLFGRLFMGMRIGSTPLLVLAIAATSACFTGLMMLLSVAGRTISSVSGIGWGCNVTFAMIGGGMIPLAFMPPWLRAVSHLSPVKWGILSLEGAIWRDFSLAEMLPPVLVLLAVGAAAFGAGAWIESKREG